MPTRSAAAAKTPVDTRDLIEGLGKGLRVIEAFDGVETVIVSVPRLASDFGTV